MLSEQTRPLGGLGSCALSLPVHWGPRSVMGPEALPWPVNTPLLLPQAVELPDSFSPELRSLLEGLLQRDVNRRLGCLGRG